MESTNSDISVSKQNENELHQQQLDIMNVNSYLTGNQLHLALETLRHKYCNENIYYASTEATSIIEDWTPAQGWFRFARIFRSRLVCHEKPDGLYLIPLFSGNTSSGHWYLAAIFKLGRSKKGFIFDSLNTGSLNDPLLRKLTKAFAPGRGTVEWTAPTCIGQTQVECGPRTIATMLSLSDSIQRRETISNSVQKATLTGTYTTDTYDELGIRRLAADLVGEFRSHMRTAPIRDRQREVR